MAAKQYSVDTKKYKVGTVITGSDGAQYKVTSGGHLRDTKTGAIYTGSTMPSAKTTTTKPTTTTPTTNPPATTTPSAPEIPTGGSDTSPPDATLGKDSLGFSPVSNETPTTVGEAINQNIEAGSRAQLVSEAGSNANYNDYRGGQVVTFDPKTGQPTVTANLSDANKAVLNNIQGNAQHAGNLVGGFLRSDGTVQGDGSNPLSALQSATYNRLTGAGSTNGIEATYKRDKEQLDQTLTNRGIPVGSIAYKQQMDSLDQNYELAKQNARDSALQAVTQAIPTYNNLQTQGFMPGEYAAFQGTPMQTNLGDNPLNTLVSADVSRDNTNAQVRGAQNVANTQGSTAKYVAETNANAVIRAAEKGAFSNAPLPGSNLVTNG